MKGIIGRKLGMTQIFDPESGRVTPVTVIEAGPCPVVQVKTVEADGYEAVQLISGEIADRKVTKPMKGHFEANGGTTGRHVVELRTDNAAEYAPCSRTRSRSR